MDISDNNFVKYEKIVTDSVVEEDNLDDIVSAINKLGISSKDFETEDVSNVSVIKPKVDYCFRLVNEALFGDFESCRKDISGLISQPDECDTGTITIVSKHICVSNINKFLELSKMCYQIDATIDADGFMEMVFSIH